MGRVDIQGQFNSDHPACSDGRRIHIDRNPSSISTANVRNWNGFCGAVDEALAPLARTKKIAKISNALLYIFLLVWIFGIQVLPAVLGRSEMMMQRGIYYMFVPVMLAFLGAFIYVRTALATVMKRVKGVCEQYSAMDSGVKYVLESEHWGGCNKPHVKRWFIVVDVDEERNATATADAEQPRETTNVSAPDYFSTQATSPDYFSTTAGANQQQASAVATPYFSTASEQPANDDAPATSLEEMLKN